MTRYAAVVLWFGRQVRAHYAENGEELAGVGGFVDPVPEPFPRVPPRTRTGR